jgi:hypothetical protein
MRRRVPLRLLLVGGAVLLLVLAVTGVVRACTAPTGLTFAQYRTLMQSGSLAGVSNTLTSAPARPSFNLEQQQASYLNVPTCSTYWASAEEHQLGTAGATPVDPASDLVDGVDTELWDDPGAAAAAMDSWAACLRDFQEANLATSYPVQLISHGVTGEVVWQYSENLDLTHPVHLLVLRDRNLIATFQVPDNPAPDWRDQLVGRLAADVTAAAKT